MQVSELATGLGQGVTFRRFVVTYLDLQAIVGAGAKTVALFSLPIGAIILGVRQKHSVAFAGGALSAMTVSTGKSGTATYFTAAQDVFAAVADGTVQETALFKHGQFTALPVIATFTPTGDTVAAATAGSVAIDIAFLNPSVDFTTL